MTSFGSYIVLTLVVVLLMLCSCVSMNFHTEFYPGNKVAFQDDLLGECEGYIIKIVNIQVVKDNKIITTSIPRYDVFAQCGDTKVYVQKLETALRGID